VTHNVDLLKGLESTPGADGPLRRPPGTEPPSRKMHGTGMSIFAAFIGIITGAHLLFVAPGVGGATLTGVLYLIAMVASSPLLFFTLTRPLGRPELRFIATYLALVLATAPIFFFPSLTLIGWSLALLLALAALIPTWVHEARLQGQLERLEGSDPRTLVHGLESDQSTLRVTARRRLLELGDDAVPTLIDRYEASRGDQAHHRDTIAQLLVQLTRESPEDGEATRAQAALSAFWQRLLRSDRHRERLQQALEGIAQMKDPRHAQLLLRHLTTEITHTGPRTLARENYANSLVAALASIARRMFNLATSGTEGLTLGRDLNQALLKYLINHPDDDSFEVIAQIGAPLVPSIARMMNDGSPTVRKHLTRLLGSLKALAAATLLLEWAQDPSGEVRFHALTALTNYLPSPWEPLPLGTAIPAPLHRQIIDTFIQQAHDDHLKARTAALNALSLNGGPDALPILLEFLSAPPSSGEDGNLRGSVAANLARGKDPLVLEPLLQLTAHAEPAVVAGAARGLGHFKDPKALTRLKELLQQSLPPTALSAAIGLARLGNDSGRKLLLNALIEPENPLRFETLEALGFIPNLSFVAVLEAGIASPGSDWTPRELTWSVQRLINWKVPEGAQALERLWNNPDLPQPSREILQAKLSAAGILTSETQTSEAQTSEAQTSAPANSSGKSDATLTTPKPGTST